MMCRLVRHVRIHFFSRWLDRTGIPAEGKFVLATVAFIVIGGAFGIFVLAKYVERLDATGFCKKFDLCKLTWIMRTPKKLHAGSFTQTQKGFR